MTDPVSPIVSGRRSVRRTAVSALRELITTQKWGEDQLFYREAELAVKLDISRGTLRTALKELEGEGLLKPRQGRGRVVISSDKPMSTPHRVGSGVLNKSISLISSTCGRTSSFRRKGFEAAVDVGVSDAVDEAGLNLLMLHPNSLGSDGLSDLIAGMPAGVVVGHRVCLDPAGQRVIATLVAAGVRVVAHGDAPGLASCDRVTTDHEIGCWELTSFLIAKGRTRILRLWGEARPLYWIHERNSGYERAMREAGLTALPACAVPGLLPRDNQTPEIFGVRVRQYLGFLAEWLTRADPVDAILAHTDSDAFCIAAACRLMGKEPGRDVLIAGYDGYWRQSPERQLEPSVPVATVDKDNDKVGRELVRLLLARAGGQLPPEPQHVRVEAKLAVT